jgi:hypothetical protein
MILIAHRGLINGPDKNLENNPSQIQQALSLGFDCEIDIWKVEDEFFLGHDSPTYPISSEYLVNCQFWVHAKNFEALEWLINKSNSINFFWHEQDQYAVTSKHFIWTCDQKYLTNRTVLMKANLKDVSNINCFAVCSDYVSLIKKINSIDLYKNF